MRSSRTEPGFGPSWSLLADPGGVDRSAGESPSRPTRSAGRTGTGWAKPVSDLAGAAHFRLVDLQTEVVFERRGEGPRELVARSIARHRDLEIVAVLIPGDLDGLEVVHRLAHGRPGTLWFGIGELDESLFLAARQGDDSLAARLGTTVEASRDAELLAAITVSSAEGAPRRPARVVASVLRHLDGQRRFQRAEGRRSVAELSDEDFLRKCVMHDVPESWRGLEPVLERIAAFPIREEENSHKRRFRDVPPESKEAWLADVDFVAFAHLRLVLSEARKYLPGRRSLGMLDLFQEGFLGLRRAVELFDPGRDTMLSTYATYWIKQHIRRAIEASDHFFRKPSYRWGELGSEDVTWKRPLDVDMLDDEALSSRVYPADREREPSEVAIERERRLVVLRTLRGLKLRDRRIIACRRELLKGRSALTLEELAKQHGVTRERVRQIQWKAERSLWTRLRRFAEQDLGEVVLSVEADEPHGVDGLEQLQSEEAAHP